MNARILVLVGTLDTCWYVENKWSRGNISTDGFRNGHAFLYQGRMSPIFWVFAYRHATWIYNRILHSTLGSYSPFELVHARRPRFDRLHTLFCDCYEWIPGPKTPGINKGRKMIYLGISETCDVGYLVFEPESRTVRTVYNVVFDETFKQRGNALRTYDATRRLDNQHLTLWRSLFLTAQMPVCMQAL